MVLEPSASFLAQPLIIDHHAPPHRRAQPIAKRFTQPRRLCNRCPPGSATGAPRGAASLARSGERDGCVEAELDLGIDGLSGFKEVGAGGFAITYSAYEADQDRTVAVKVLHEADDDGRRRFDRERRTMGNTTGHANIVTLFRSGFTSIGNKPYMVMEYLSGGSLQDRLDHHGYIDLSEAIDLIFPVAEALGYSHQSGIVHKDVKPANILVSGTGVVKLTDFGIAALRDTTTSQVAYSPSYAPPESFDAYRDASGQLVDLRDGRSDLYSLAASLFTLVTGTPPFDGTQLATMRQIADSPVPQTGHPGLDAFLNVAMAKQPEHRFQTAEAFIAALHDVKTNRHSALAPPASPNQPAPAQGIAPSSRPLTANGLDDRAPQTIPSQDFVDDVPAQGSRRAPVVAFFSVVGVAMVGAIVAAVMLSNSSNSDETPIVDQAGQATQAVDDIATQGQGGVVTFSGHAERVRSAVELPDGRIASVGEDRAFIWDPEQPDAEPTSYDAHGQVFGPLSMILLSDGRVASNSSQVVHIWDPADPSVTIASYGDEGIGSGSIISQVELPDGRIASSSGGDVNIWHPSDPATTLAVYSGHGTGQISALAVLPDGRIASAMRAAIHIWDPDDPDTTQVVYEGHDNSEALEAVLNEGNDPDDQRRNAAVWVTSVVGLADGRIVSAGRDGFQNPIHIWNPESPEEPLDTRVVSDPVTALLVMDDGRIVDGDEEGEISIWNADEPQDSDASFSGHIDMIWDISQLADGRLLTTSEDTTVQIWDPSCDGIDPGFGPYEQLLCR